MLLTTIYQRQLLITLLRMPEGVSQPAASLGEGR
jgi:hypothetical protein